MKVAKKNRSPKPKLELVAGELRPGSFNAVLYQALEKGGEFTVGQLARSVPKCTNVLGRLVGLRKRGLPVEKTEDGTWYLKTAKAIRAGVQARKRAA